MLFLMTSSVILVLKKCKKNFDFFVNEMLYIKLQKRPPLNSQMDSIHSQVFVLTRCIFIHANLFISFFDNGIMRSQRRPNIFLLVFACLGPIAIM